ncbi:YciI family protein [Streptomyces sp. NBC_00286]|uniref:YciI family protein n=1 Tax=Streptomyces sp. NBC_00286 TaxID=2975701 RepID=UPI002E2CFA1E|nr:YciI family protein [Streptomyces sp. NBC_00286]
MVQMLSKRDDWDAIMGSLTGEDVQRLVRYNVELDEELRKRGELLEDRGLAGPQAVTTVQAVPGGEPRVTQGPYRPDEQFLVGYWVIEVDSMERAVEIAARISVSPGPGGEPVNIPVELHAVPPRPA